MSRHYFDSVIFDLDGVVTKTALVHAKAWKEAFDEYLRLREKRDKEPFREFTHENDYLPYVDGKPRYQGVKSFLESRNVNIAFGEPTDSPDTETVCGIGNKKNVKFLEVLKKLGVEIYPSTVELIKKLKAAGIRIGVASSSKNCQHILKSAGIEDLFETRVDGVVSAEIGLKGKPEGDIFVTAAANIDTMPERSVVVEDATSGVQAGRNGGFGLVIGVAREKNENDLLENGADVAVVDLAPITVEWIDQWFHRRPSDLFKSWEKNDAQQKEENNILLNPCYAKSAQEVFLAKKKPVFFLDYDGTLTPIVSRPDLAVISEEMKATVVELSEKFTTAIVSGRMREDVQKLAGVENIVYSGSHGFDILGPNISMIMPAAKEAIPIVDKLSKQLKKELGDIKGILFEEKKFSLAVHYRLVEDEFQVAKIKEAVDEAVKEYSTLRVMCGKKVFEILPAFDWNKGKAIRWIMQTLKISWNDVSVVYIGDDTTDEDAFRAVRTRGAGILVSDKLKESMADFQVSTPDEVMKLFKKVIG